MKPLAQTSNGKLDLSKLDAKLNRLAERLDRLNEQLVDLETRMPEPDDFRQTTPASKPRPK